MCRMFWKISMSLKICMCWHKLYRTQKICKLDLKALHISILGQRNTTEACGDYNILFISVPKPACGREIILSPQCVVCCVEPKLVVSTVLIEYMLVPRLQLISWYGNGFITSDMQKVFWRAHHPIGLVSWRSTLNTS
jgi:hypothetical protein